MYCKKCGNEISTGNSFCRYCGAKTDSFFKALEIGMKVSKFINIRIVSLIMVVLSIFMWFKPWIVFTGSAVSGLKTLKDSLSGIIGFARMLVDDDESEEYKVAEDAMSIIGTLVDNKLSPRDMVGIANKCDSVMRTLTVLDSWDEDDLDEFYKAYKSFRIYYIGTLTVCYSMLVLSVIMLYFAFTGKKSKIDILRFIMYVAALVGYMVICEKAKSATDFLSNTFDITVKKEWFSLRPTLWAALAFISALPFSVYEKILAEIGVSSAVTYRVAPFEPPVAGRPEHITVTNPEPERFAMPKTEPEHAKAPETGTRGLISTFNPPKSDSGDTYSENPVQDNENNMFKRGGDL